MIIDVVRGFSLVMHDPEGSHYKIRRCKACNLVRGMRLPCPDKSGLAMTKSVVLDESSFGGGKE